MVEDGRKSILDVEDGNSGFRVAAIIGGGPNAFNRVFTKATTLKGI